MLETLELLVLKWCIFGLILSILTLGAEKNGLLKESGIVQGIAFFAV